MDLQAERGASRSGGAGSLLLIALLLLLTLGVLFAALVPVLECPNNWTHARVIDAAVRGRPIPDCERCSGRGRVTLLNRWLRGPGGELGG